MGERIGFPITYNYDNAKYTKNVESNEIITYLSTFVKDPHLPLHSEQPRHQVGFLAFHIFQYLWTLYQVLHGHSAKKQHYHHKKDQ
jgi:hypothetical protein